MTAQHKLVALPSGQAGDIAHGTTLRTALRQLGIGIESICAENATCGKCKILVETGRFEDFGVTSSPAHISPADAEEVEYFGRRQDMLRRRGWDMGQVRLSCQARLLGDLVVTVPDESRTERQFVPKSAIGRPIEVKPSLRKYLVELTAPSLSNPRADWDRLASGVATSMGLVAAGSSRLPSARDLTIDRPCLIDLPAALRRAHWRVTATVWQDREVVQVQPGLNDRLVGAALDIGTTTLALYICDLDSGEVLATESDLNPQTEHGADVMSRIQYCIENPDGLRTLHKTLVKAVNRMLLRGAAAAGVQPEDVLELAVVGNTTMVHLFLDISPAYLGSAPFAPVVAEPVNLKARELRLLMNRCGNVHVLPAIASFIGADTTAVLLAQAPHLQDDNWLIIDIGTNAELVLGNRKRLLCASTPTGPALEGGHLEHGMRAGPGAIERFRIGDSGLKPMWKLIGESAWNTGRPKGMCGSAVIDVIAELLRIGLLDSAGRLQEGHPLGDAVRRTSAGLEYVVARAETTHGQADICLTQKDIRQVQLAKAALFVAATSLLERSGLGAPDQLILAGAFGSVIDKRNAVAIGMLPEMPEDDILVVGNAAGEGARIALLNEDKRREALEVAGRIARHELPADPEFQRRFIQALAFPDVLSRSRGAQNDKPS